MTRRSRSGARPAPPAAPSEHPSSPREKDLRETERALRARIAERDRWFDEARTVRRAAQDAMRRFHAGEDPGPALRGLAGQVRDLQRSAAGSEGIISDALQEFAEARFLEAVVRGRPLPSLGTLGIPVEEYLSALGDLVGEVRRLVISSLGLEDLQTAERLLRLMEDLLHALLRFEAPRGVVALKPKQDVARTLVERTRADVALARVLRRAADALQPSEGGRWVAEGLKATSRLHGSADEREGRA